jgi:hypothetical protein
MDEDEDDAEEAFCVDLGLELFSCFDEVSTKIRVKNDVTRRK